MNYNNIYQKLISARIRRGKPDGYCERHHIIPKSLGGGDNNENLIYLTAREHFIAHLLLMKIFPNSGMVHAAFKMACINKKNVKFKITAKTYEKLRIAHALRVSSDEKAKEKKSLSMLGRKQTPAHIKARTESRKSNGIWHSNETKIKIGESKRGKKGYWKDHPITKEMIEARKKTMRAKNGWEWSEERRIKQSERLRGKPNKKLHMSEEQKKQLSIEKSKKVICPHCLKEGAIFIMARWHFNNCKKFTK